MKKKISIIDYLLFAMLVLTMSCKKQDLPQPAPPAQSIELRFSVAFLPGTPNSNTDAFAMVTVVDKNNQEVITNRKLALNYDTKYTTEKIELPNGDYKLTSFMIINGAGFVRYAAPLINFPKASSVQKPLAISFVTPNREPLTLPVEVLKVEAGDTPESFGYPAGSFTFPPTEASNFHMLLRTAITVGDIVYDSIPADFTIMFWDENGVLHQRDTLLPAGINRIDLPKSYTKYGFQMRKWGLTVELTLLKNEMNEATVYTIGGNKAAKKLKEATEYRFINGAFELYQKKLFDYDNEGRVKEVKHYSYSLNDPQLKHALTELYRYARNKLEIYRVDVQNGSSEPILFATYDFDGVGNRTRSELHAVTERAIYEHAYSNQVVTMYNLHTDGSRTGSKTLLSFEGGNLVEQRWLTPVSASGYRYSYDFNINPYVHMKWPDLFYTNISKNNVLKLVHLSANASEQEAFMLQNSYDSDGYLTVVNRGSSKTVFAY